MPEFPDWDAPQGHANAIAATGVPLLHLKTSLAAPTSQTVAAGNTLQLPTPTTFYNLGQISYEIAFQVWTAAATASRFQVQLRWYDSATGRTTSVRNVYAYAATTATTHWIIGRGPVRGDDLQVWVTAEDNTIVFNAVILASSIPYMRDRWETTIPGNIPVFPGFTSAVYDPDGGWLASVSSSVAAAGSTTTLLPLYTGLVTVNGTTTDTTAGESELRIVDAADFFGVPPSTTHYRIFSGQGDSIHAFIILGRALPLPASQCQLVQANNNASTPFTISGNVVSHEMATG